MLLLLLVLNWAFLVKSLACINASSCNTTCYSYYSTKIDEIDKFGCSGDELFDCKNNSNSLIIGKKLNGNKGFLRCCNDTDNCNNRTILIHPPNFLKNTKFKSAFYKLSCVLDIVICLLITSIPILYYWFKIKLMNKNIEFDIFPILEDAIIFNEMAIWPSEPWENSEGANGQLDLKILKEIISSIEKNVGKTKPEIISTIETNENIVTFGLLINHKKTGSNMVIYDRLRSSKYDQLLYQMIEHGPGSFYVHPMQINEIFDKAFCIFSAEETLLELKAPIVIIGDLRGQYVDFFRWLKLTGFPPKQKILILGGFFDGTICGSIELLVFIAALKVALPYNFFVIRGVTEFIGVNLKHGFSKRVCADLSSAALRMFSQMPLAAVINQKILCVHSGISSKIKSFKSISSIKRPIMDMTCPKIVLDLLFNLPNPKIQKTKPIPKGHGQFFGETVVEQILNRLNLELIIRGRNSSPQGYFLFNNRRVLTIWSAIGRDSKFGVVAIVEKNLEIILKRIETEEKIVTKCCPKNTWTKTQSIRQSVEGQENIQQKSNKL